MSSKLRSRNLKAPSQSYPILACAPAVLRSDQWPVLRPITRFFFFATRNRSLAMMCMIDVLTDPVTQCTADQHVRKIMIASREARDADRAGDSISGDLHEAVIVIFVSDYRRQ